MRISQLCIVLCYLLPLGVGAQFQTLDPIRFVSFYAGSTFQSNQHFTDTTGTFHRGSFSAGVLLPIVHKVWEGKSTPTSWDLQVHPAVNYVRLNTDGSERMLNNPQLTVSSFLGFLNSNRLSINIRGQLNEDEFTATYPKLLFNGTAYYSRGIGQRLRLHAGAGYSFILGDKRWYPIAGADFTIGNHSRITLLYPLIASYQASLTERFQVSAFAKPTGLMSFMENRLNIPDTSKQTLIFSLQSVSIGAEISWLLRPSLTVMASVAYSPQQTSTLQNRDETITYYNHQLSDAFVGSLRLIWRPWLQSQRNKNKPPYHFKQDNDLIIPF